MKVEIVEKVENPLFKRMELKLRVDHTGGPTPRRVEVKSQLAALLGVEEDRIIIEKITSSHGHQIASGIARVYESKEQLERIEPKYLLRRGLPKEEKAKPAEAPKKPEEAKAEKPKSE